MQSAQGLRCALQALPVCGLAGIWAQHAAPLHPIRGVAVRSSGEDLARVAACAPYPSSGGAKPRRIVFSTTLLVPAAFQALETRRLLATELWPGWEWGSFRWALVFHALLSFVAYPLCALVGGLWSLRTDDGHGLAGDTDAAIDVSE